MTVGDCGAHFFCYLKEKHMVLSLCTLERITNGADIHRRSSRAKKLRPTTHEERLSLRGGEVPWLLRARVWNTPQFMAITYEIFVRCIWANKRPQTRGIKTRRGFLFSAQRDHMPESATPKDFHMRISRTPLGITPRLSPTHSASPTQPIFKSTAPS